MPLHSALYVLCHTFLDIFIICGLESSRFLDCKLLQFKESTSCFLLHFQYLIQCFVFSCVLNKYILGEIATFAEQPRGKLVVYS